MRIIEYTSRYIQYTTLCGAVKKNTKVCFYNSMIIDIKTPLNNLIFVEMQNYWVLCQSNLVYFCYFCVSC